MTNLTMYQPVRSQPPNIARAEIARYLDDVLALRPSIALREGFDADEIVDSAYRVLRGTYITQNNYAPLYAEFLQAELALDARLSALPDAEMKCGPAVAELVGSLVAVFVQTIMAGLSISASGVITKGITGVFREALANNPAYEASIVAIFKGISTAATAQAKAGAVIKAIVKLCQFVSLNTILNAIYDDMRWYDWLIFGTLLAAQIAAFILSDGLSFIAEVVALIAGLVSLSMAIVKVRNAC